MNFTDGVALYGAIVATAGVIWNILLFLKDAPSIKLSVMLGYPVIVTGRTVQAWRSATVPAEATHLLVSIVNHGRRPALITKLYFTIEGQDGVALAVPHELPKMLKENESVFEYTHDLEFMKRTIKSVAVLDSTDKAWKLRRSQIRGLNRDAERLGFRT